MSRGKGLTVKRQPPDKIYLQWLGADAVELTPEQREEPAAEMTWCVDKIYDTDVEYVRVK